MIIYINVLLIIYVWGGQVPSTAEVYVLPLKVGTT
jgi:hypothetical protein